VASVIVTSATVGVGATVQLTATLKDAAGSVLTGRTVTWASGNTAVATVSSTGLVTGVAAGHATITATSEGKSGTAVITVSLRATSDRADDVSGNQIHVLYVLPSDGTDRRLDTDGTLQNTVGSFQTWLAGQTGGRKLRMDTYSLALDITFFRLSRTDAAMKSYGAFVRDTIEKELAQAGFNSSTKIYAAYYDGGSTFACGGGAWPPALPGKVAALYLEGTPSGAPPCNTNPFAASPTAAPGYIEFAMIHEIMHTMGFVSSGAPHSVAAGHVSDSNLDLMYAGALAWQPSTLDVGHDDYYGTTLPAGVLNLAASPFLLP